MKRWFLLKILSFIFLATSYSLWAIDSVRMTASHSAMDKRTEYKNEVIIRALELTVDEFGPFDYKLLDIRMNRYRALPAIQKGYPNNIYIAPANKLWDENTTAIKIPIRRGLLNYRLLLINKKNIKKFEQVKTLDDLKSLTGGLRNGWITVDVFKKAGLNTVTSENFDGLFVLLDSHHFDYIPRGIYEIFDEYDLRKDFLKNISIEQNIVIHLPMPTYIYVSPQAPRVSARLEKGLRKMLANGDLDKLIEKYYADDIKRAKLKNRRIIRIHNPYFTDQELLKDKALWYQL